jgi:hypothetical protein
MRPPRRAAFVELEGDEITLFDRMREHLGYQSDANLLRGALWHFATARQFSPGRDLFAIRLDRRKRRVRQKPAPRDARCQCQVYETCEYCRPATTEPPAHEQLDPNEAQALIDALNDVKAGRTKPIEQIRRELADYRRSPAGATTEPREP